MQFNGYTFSGAVKKCLSQYANFQGRATRSEYWFFFLFLVIINFVFPFLGGMFKPINEWLSAGFSLLWVLSCLATFIPYLAVSVRRLHDIGKSGWLLLLGFIPYIGGIILLILFCMDSQRSTNKYGVSEKYPKA